MRSEVKKPLAFIDVNGRGLPPNLPVSIEYLCDRLGVSDRTLVQYRKIAYRSIATYRISALARNPRYLPAKLREMQRIKAGERAKKVYPDSPPFPPLEVHILEAVASLFRQFKSVDLVQSYIERYPEFWRKYKNADCNERTQPSNGQPASSEFSDRSQSSDIVALRIGGKSR